jgi:hypothetical protein
MAEMDGLKKRVEFIDLRLKKAHSAREEESAALMDTWQQIRDRFQDQGAEVIKLRGQIADLEDSRNDLLKMVHSLLEAVEGGLDSMADETVPQIKMMAGQLLSQNRDRNDEAQASTASGGSRPEPAPVGDTVATASSQQPNFRDDLLTAIEQTIYAADKEDVVADYPPLEPVNGSSHTDKSEPASPGIRNLISRIESAVGEDFLEPQFVGDSGEPETDDDLTRDLREIETLRHELHGLRHRIAAGA